MNRDELEKLAMEKVDPALYYDLADNIDQATDSDLYDIINNTGSYAETLEDLDNA